MLVNRLLWKDRTCCKLALHLDEPAFWPLQHSNSRSQMVVLQRGDVIVHDPQRMEGLDQVVIVDPQVLKVMCER